MSPIRLALLDCDRLLPSVVAIAGDYHSIFTTLLRNAGKSCGDPDFILDPYDVFEKQEYPPDNVEYDGIIITGSKASVYDNVEWINKLVAYVTGVVVSKPQTKIIGICFGHQIVGRALGGECVPHSGKWELGITEVQLTDLGQRIFGVPTMNIQQMHKDHVPTVLPGFHLLGSTPIAPVQSMVKFSSASSYSSTTPNTPPLTDIHILTLLGHPEFTSPIVEAVIVGRSSTGSIDAPTAEDARRRANRRNDGVVVFGRTLWRVFGVEVT